MESGKSSGSGFFHPFLGLCGFWFLASTRLHISGFFLQSSFPCKALGFCFSVSLAYEWLWLAVTCSEVDNDLSAPGPIASQLP